MFEGNPQIDQGVQFANGIIQQISGEIYKIPQDTIILVLLLTMVILFFLLIFSVRRVRGGKSKKRFKGMGDEEMVIPLEERERPVLEPKKSLLEDKHLDEIEEIPLEFPGKKPETSEAPRPEKVISAKEPVVAEKKPIQEKIIETEKKPETGKAPPVPAAPIKGPPQEEKEETIERIFADFPREGVSLVVKIKPSKVLERIVEKVVEVPMGTGVERIDKEAGQGKQVYPYPINEEIQLEEDTDLITASELLTKKYSFMYLTIADSQGLVVASTSPVPDEDAENALTLSKQLGMGEDVRRVAISGLLERYLIYLPLNSNHAVINIVTKEHIPGHVFKRFEEEVMKYLENII